MSRQLDNVFVFYSYFLWFDESKKTEVHILENLICEVVSISIAIISMEFHVCENLNTETMKMQQKYPAMGTDHAIEIYK